MSTIRAKIASCQSESENNAIWVAICPLVSAAVSVGVSEVVELVSPSDSVSVEVAPMWPPSSWSVPWPVSMPGCAVLSAMELTMALKRSSWARSALRTCQTTLKRRLSERACDGDMPAGTATGRMMYP